MAAIQHPPGGHDHHQQQGGGAMVAPEGFQVNDVRLAGLHAPEHAGVEGVAGSVTSFVRKLFQMVQGECDTVVGFVAGQFQCAVFAMCKNFSGVLYVVPEIQSLRSQYRVLSVAADCVWKPTVCCFGMHQLVTAVLVMVMAMVVAAAAAAGCYRLRFIPLLLLLATSVHFSVHPFRGFRVLLALRKLHSLKRHLMIDGLKMFQLKRVFW